MPNATNIAERLETLLRQRQEHADAIDRIDQMLERVAGVLTTEGSRGRPAASGAPVARRGRKRGRRSRFPTSGNESILTFVRDHPGATTQEIKQHWASEGRGGGADNALSLLTKAKKLRRTRLGKEKGVRGSTYSV